MASPRRGHPAVFDGDPDAAYDSIASSAWAAGSLTSTTGELAAFFDALFAGKLVSPDALDEMTEAGPDGYGLGLGVLDHPSGTRFYGHRRRHPRLHVLRRLRPQHRRHRRRPHQQRRSRRPRTRPHHHRQLVGHIRGSEHHGSLIARAIGTSAETGAVICRRRCALSSLKAARVSRTTGRPRREFAAPGDHAIDVPRQPIDLPRETARPIDQAQNVLMEDVRQRRGGVP